MSDAGEDPAPIGGEALGGVTAGAMLREAREKRGLHIAALAASIKVAPRKLEALEADRYAELPDMTFTRALAQTVCRVLKVDPEPVLGKLPQAGDLPKLAKVGGGINKTFREAPGSHDPGDFTFYRRPVFWATLIVLLCAIALALIPERWVPWHGAANFPSLPVPAAVVEPLPTAAPAAGLPPAVLDAPGTGAAGLVQVTAVVPPAAASAAGSIETVHSAPPQSLTGGSETGTTVGVLALRTSAESWVEVQDGRGQTLLSRTVQPGETVGLDGPFPLRLTIGNAAATQLTFRGEAVDLSSSTRDNVARLQLPQR